MRTRSQGPPILAQATQLRVEGQKREGAEILEDDASANGSPVEQQCQTNQLVVATPRKTNKRVRFSAPAFTTIIDEDDSLRSHNSTGLTPAMRRTRLSCTPTCETTTPRRRRHANNASRRSSLPARLSMPHSPSSGDIQEISFTPLRQALDDRVRRRLRRSHMSEELNSIAEEQRTQRKSIKQELERLRSQEGEKGEKIKELELELELQRQRGIAVNAEEEAQVEALRDEIKALRQKIDIKEEGAGEYCLAVDGFENALSPLAQSASTLYDDSLQDTDFPTSPLDYHFSNHTTTPTRAAPNYFPLTPASAATQNTVTDACIQVSMGTPPATHRSIIADLEATVAHLRRETSDARTALELVTDDLKAMGFAVLPAAPLSPSSSPPSAQPQIIGADDIIAAMRATFRRARLALEHLLPGETPTNLDASNDAKLPTILLSHLERLLKSLTSTTRDLDTARAAESAMRRQFNGVLERAAHLENRHTVIAAQHDKLKATTSAALERVATLERTSAADSATLRDRVYELEGESARHAARAAELDRELAANEQGRERLKEATARYRDEITSLEALVMEMERQSSSTISALQKRVEEVGERARRDRAALESRQVREKEILEAGWVRAAEKARGELKREREAHGRTKDTLDGLLRGSEGRMKEMVEFHGLAKERAKRDSGVCMEMELDQDVMEGEGEGVEGAWEHRF